MPPPADVPDPWDGADPWATGDEESGPVVSAPDTVQGRPVVETPLPETDDADPPNPNAKAGDGLLRAVFAGLNKIGAADNDDLRHAIATAIVGYRVLTYRELSRKDALKMVGVLSDLETGVLTLTIGPDGAVKIHGKENAP